MGRSHSRLRFNEAEVSARDHLSGAPPHLQGQIGLFAFLVGCPWKPNFRCRIAAILHATLECPSFSPGSSKAETVIDLELLLSLPTASSHLAFAPSTTVAIPPRLSFSSPQQCE